ncbi:MAG: glycosyltransferase [Saprospiraceae bacterium]|nr:glycosyltransferase [Saprospiraceae bacterium]MBK7810569.1 glycosyltransferase [Saprospiraceae bacterium]MBK9630160.1 glycosyltransferase [Saprospiraceae bacterium]
MILLTGIQVLMWLTLFSGLSFHKNKNRRTTSEQIHFPVSIIICVHNQKEQIVKVINRLMTQKYIEYEIIISDDGSTDGLLDWYYNILKSNSKIRYLYQTKGESGKKSALTSAIKLTKYDYILLTDADCTPATDFWIAEMINVLRNGNQMVLAYSPYLKRNGILNYLIRFENTLNGIQYLSAALRGLPYMGVGRNLLYHKSLFNKDLLKPNISFGDDDLFVNQVASQISCAICIHPSSFVWSEPEKSWLSYFHQRRRHFAASKHYKWFDKFLLGIYHFSLLGFYLFLMIGLCINPEIYLLWLYSLRMLIVWPIFAASAKKLNAKDLILYFPFLEILYILFLCTQIPFLIQSPKKWSYKS